MCVYRFRFLSNNSSSITHFLRKNCVNSIKKILIISVKYVVKQVYISYFKNMQEETKETYTIEAKAFLIYCKLGSSQAINLTKFFICIIHEIIAIQ